MNITDITDKHQRKHIGDLFNEMNEKAIENADLFNDKMTHSQWYSIPYFTSVNRDNLKTIFTELNYKLPRKNEQLSDNIFIDDAPAKIMSCMRKISMYNEYPYKALIVNDVLRRKSIGSGIYDYTLSVLPLDNIEEIQKCLVFLHKKMKELHKQISTETYRRSMIRENYKHPDIELMKEYQSWHYFFMTNFLHNT